MRKKKIDYEIEFSHLRIKRKGILVRSHVIKESEDRKQQLWHFWEQLVKYIHANLLEWNSELITLVQNGLSKISRENFVDRI